MITKGIMISVAIGVFLVGLGVGFGVFASSSPSFDKQIEDQNAKITALESDLKSTNEEIGALQETMDEIMGMMQGDMMGNGMGDMMNQEPQDVIIKMKSGQKVQVGKEAEIVLLVLDKETQKPMEGVQVVIGIERGSSMSSMDMMGDMFDAEEKGSGEYIVRFTPDREGIYTIHTMVMLPGRSMMDNHMDFGIIAETSDV
ncbi:MAG: hypothetical protein ACRD32_06575 [Nitrososphaerales archaeon]